LVTVSQFRPHPVHGLSMGREPPEFVNAYIEITPFDLMKYEVDKTSGYLRLDRPQRTSATPPTLYGFIPRTHCDVRVAKLSRGATRGDGDPLDICVLSERPVVHNEIIVPARVIGGLELNDGGEADDKIIAVIENDHVWGNATSLADVPAIHVERLQHYFLTYKMVPGKPNKIHITRFYNRQHALRVVRAAMADYSATYSF
jgi:inorganic pyrophosphatase